MRSRKLEQALTPVGGTEQAAGKIEWHIPREFTAERLAVRFSHVKHRVSAAEPPTARKIPALSERPMVVGDPHELADLACEEGYQPGEISDYLWRIFRC